MKDEIRNCCLGFLCGVMFIIAMKIGHIARLLEQILAK